MPSPRRLTCIVWLLFTAACVRQARPVVGPPSSNERILALPLADTLARARDVLVEQGLTVDADPPGALLRTVWVQGPGEPRRFTRHVVAGARVDARRSIVRIFRVDSPSAGEPAPGEVRWTRDASMEQQLAAGLPPGSVAEAPGGAIHVEAELPLVREPDFYLERWRLEGTGGLAARERCGRYVEGMRALVRPRLTLLVGEQLGSREAPEVVGDLVCEAAEGGLDVALGLSIPRTEQERVDQYLSSLGSPADQDELLRGDFWRSPYQDGRASWAVVDLLDRVRALRASGLSISVVAYDTHETSGSERDARMAEVWLKRRAERGGGEAFIVLAGNAHTQIVRGAAWDRDFIPMAWRLAQADPGMKTLELSYAQGRRWGCELTAGDELSCRIVEAAPSDRVAGTPGQEPHIRMFSRLSWGFHGLLYVGALSPSMPATALAGHEPPPAESVIGPIKNQQRRLKLY